MSYASTRLSDNASPSDQTAIFDTVVINYFLQTERLHLLAELCGGSIAIPRAVFDPDEDDGGREEGLSELRRGMHLHRRRSTEDGAPPEVRDLSSRLLPRFEVLPQLTQQGVLQVVDLTLAELIHYANLRDASYVRRFGLVVGLGPGEAAVIAVCLERGWRPATDDNAAIKVLASLLPHVKPLRIRALLRLAVERGLLAVDEARQIHEEMKSLGFWDKGSI